MDDLDSADRWLGCMEVVAIVMGSGQIFVAAFVAIQKPAIGWPDLMLSASRCCPQLKMGVLAGVGFFLLISLMGAETKLTVGSDHRSMVAGSQGSLVEEDEVSDKAVLWCIAEEKCLDLEESRAHRLFPGSIGRREKMGSPAGMRRRWVSCHVAIDLEILLSARGKDRSKI
ncbi:hypothetical protein ACLOJK_006980 [Asimina triloba]